ncbi:MAG: hypothetical protein AB7S36_09020, partial [Planctomycetota bacterium]
VAEQLHAALLGADVACEVIDERLVDRPPRAGSAYYLDGWDEGLIVGKEQGGEHAWSRVAMMTIGAILPSTADGNMRNAFAAPVASSGLTPGERALLRDRAGEPPTAALGELSRWLSVVDKEGFALIDKDIPPFVLDLILREPEQRYRVEARTMIATPVGADRSPNWLRNFSVIAQRVASYIPPDALSPGARLFLDACGGYDLEFDLITEFDESVTWLWFRRRQAELDELLADDDAAPADDTDAAAGSGTTANDEPAANTAGPEEG